MEGCSVKGPRQQLCSEASIAVELRAYSHQAKVEGKAKKIKE